MTAEINRTEVLIAGMRGNACRERIAGALESVAGVVRVDVNLFRARAAIIHDQRSDEQSLIRAILRAGYEASSPGGRTGLNPPAPDRP